MHHTFYAVFTDRQRAHVVAEELRARGCPVVVHGGALDAEELDGSETSTRSGVATGGLAGAAAGALAGGIVLGPVGAGMGALAGTLFGGVGGAIVGAHAPERRLSQLEAEFEAGSVVLAIEPEGWTGEEAAEEFVRRNGGRVEHRKIV